MMNTDINCVYGTPEILGTYYGTDMRKAYIFFQAPSSFSDITTAPYKWNNTNFGICRYWQSDPHHIALIYPQMMSGAFPEPLRKIHQI